MKVKPTVDALLQRLTQLEARTAAAEERAATLEARLAGGHQTADAIQREGGNGHTGPLTRGRFMKAAGMGLAGLAGAAILEKAATKDAYATTFVDVVSAQAYIANGTGGTPTAPAGYGLNAPGSANFDRGVSAIGRNIGVAADSAGTGAGLFVGSGGRANGQLGFYGSINSNPPTTSATTEGDLLFDNNDIIWVNKGHFNEGWAALHHGGLGQTLFTGVSTQQYTLANSDGITWVDMDTTKLQLSFTPRFACQAIITINADLWTSVAGHNQDIAATITGGAFGTNKVVAWKESGSVAGAFSPNAAYLETIQTLALSTAYTIKVQWKANNPSTGVTIVAGAGPIPAASTTFSPTRITVRLIPDLASSTAPTGAATKQVSGSPARA
jgi:hypothetical protein